jgi:hypothetical protein
MSFSGAEDRASMASVNPYGQMRATDADRENIHEVLRAAYADGRLSWDEFDTRSSRLVEAKTYGQLSVLTADLHKPVPYRSGALDFPGPRQPVNALAGVSLGFGVGQVLLPFFGAIIAIVCGHVARSQMRRTGEQGEGLAQAGLILGYLGVALPILLVTLIVLVVHG